MANTTEVADLASLTTVAQTLQHPAFGDATWNLQPTRSGRLPVAAGRGGPLAIGWEVHGEGPIRVVFLMGLGSFKSAWQRQTLYFGHERHTEYSVLLLDNRGMGDSDRPLMRYSTREMALDALEVLEHVGFLEPAAAAELAALSPATTAAPTAGDAAAAAAGDAAAAARTVHVVGLSMGGMVAQELACLVPDRLASLSLCCTAALIENTSPTIWENLASRAALLIPKGLEASVEGAAGRIFSQAWLAQPDDVRLPARGTHLVGPPDRAKYVAAAAAVAGKDAATTADGSTADDTGGNSSPWYRTFDNNYQRFVAQELHKRTDPRFTTRGFLLQLVACGWHHKSAAQLAALADAVGRERLMVVHGTEDHMISVPHGRKLVEQLQPAHAHIVEGMGHAPLAERWAWYNETLAALFHKGETLAGR
ncbi:alpha beta hydrolase fold family [Niveomyces insectorum RCEF 264]|uniref:Alpha beta hydrolase fold family n=1 Tax=Niveomyces insectorum RCEF 264 TaxID=1081102 RepID=A0A167TGH6_9HYPO|nr:alpha beta hydrolase fold family [Niveomyces insectorum RCEF 264]